MENKKRFIWIGVGIIALFLVGGTAWWGYKSFFNPAPEAVYARLRSAVIAGDKEKMKSFMDASSLDPEAVKQFDKLTPESLQKMADFLAPDIAKFTPVSSDTKDNKITLIKRLDEPGATKALSTTLFAIQFIKQDDNRTYKIGRISSNSANTDSGDNKEHENGVQRNIRRLRREFGLEVKPSTLSLREQLEETSSRTTKPRFSGDESMSIKFIEAEQMGSHAAYVRTEEEPGKGFDLVLMGFNLEEGEWNDGMGGPSVSYFPPPSEEELKVAITELKNKYFVESVGLDFRDALRRDNYKSAAQLFSTDSDQTAEKLKALIDQFPTFKDSFPFVDEMQDVNATFSVGFGADEAVVDLVKENGMWKISKITPGTAKAE